MYEKCYQVKCDGVPYRFDNKKLQKVEQMYRDSKIHQERPRECYKIKETYPPKEYYSKPSTKPYEKSLFCGKFEPAIKAVTRSSDKSKNISERDFDLFTLKKAIEDNDIPPYYVDFWFGKECALHNILDF
ncbi:unnamed protein product [Brassicogethes aeneus]|uniref:Uncharacterized protein n=1 Tax=Brassicogethes aeneus TaxID=1431903 RepID=A0A9P0FBK5_BRAAE|nr:unnamed protein product [Brassicogethes aeneus]